MCSSLWGVVTERLRNTEADRLHPVSGSLNSLRNMFLEVRVLGIIWKWGFISIQKPNERPTFQ